MKKNIITVLLLVIAVVVVVGIRYSKKNKAVSEGAGREEGTATLPISQEKLMPAAAMEKAMAQKPLPKLLDLGAGKCIPCKLMAPILEEMKETFAGQLDVEFIDVWENQEAGQEYGIHLIPTQIFFDADGKELYRHEGFFSRADILATWAQLGVKFNQDRVKLVREEPIKPDLRQRDEVCYMCDGDVMAKNKTLVKGQTEQRILCSLHCYFIYFSSIPDADAHTQDAKVSVADWNSGEMLAAKSATYLYGMDNKGRPTVRAFASKDAAAKVQRSSPGALISWDILRSKEMATRCGFCDRAVYPEDACKVIVEGATHTYGCCTHCSLGVAARTGQDIEVEAYDGLTGEVIRVKTFNGSIASLDPETATAWFGQKKTEDGKWKSAGCFKQGFFSNQDNLKQWLDDRPAMTGHEITIAKALADKMKLTPEQIAQACKLGECK